MTSPEHPAAVIAQLYDGRTLAYDDGEVAVIAPRPVPHAVHAAGVLALTIACATALVVRVVLAVSPARFGSGADVGAALSTLLLVVSGILALLLALQWHRAMAEHRKLQPRVVHRGDDGQIHVLPKDVYDGREDRVR